MAFMAERYFLLGVGYDGQEKKAFLKLLNLSTNTVEIHMDSTGHKPYCLTDRPIDELEKNQALREAGATAFIKVTKYDSIADRMREMTLIQATDPLAVGGSKKSIRELVTAWEADIPYHLNYVYDMRLTPSMIYEKKNGMLTPVFGEKSKVENILQQFFPDLPAEEREEMEKWLRMLESEHPAVDFTGLDIEILSDSPTKVPSPSNPVDRVVAISFSGTRGMGKVLVLRRDGVDMTFNGGEYSVEVFDDETTLLSRCFEIMDSYPIVVTFNGDDFDLPYLRNRAEKLGIPKNRIPITLGREGASLRRGIHLDLYRFFNNKSVQVYAFDNRYREHTLDGVAKALIGVGKVELTKTLNELSLQELADYSYRDSRLLRDMVEAGDRLILRLMAVISRISKMPIEDVCRHGVSGWIKNLLYWELRGRNWLIPRKDELITAKGGTTTKAIIEGKKYRGALVVEPVPGIHFNVTVLDFASLYPSILKEYNLSFETINCSHEKCRTNNIPETTHWVCREKRGVQSSIIGVIRDIRVRWYKPMASNKSLDPVTRSWYEVVQRALKVFLNASYGVLGFEEFPLYCPPLAESTTAIGRYVFSSAVEKAKSLGVTVVYGDTDSIFLKAEKQELVHELIRWAREKFRLDLEFDKVYRYVVFSKRKKNYLGVTDRGVVDVKGLTGKKRNIPVFIKEAFDDMLKQLAEVKSAEELETVKKNIRQVIATWYSRLKNRTFEIDQLAFRVMMSKTIERYEKTTPQHVKAAKKLQSLGVKVGPGDIISYVKTKDKDGVTPLQLAKRENIDVDKYIEYMRSTFEQVLDPLEIDFDSIIGLTSLESFM
ncbi:DNA polymerase I [Candidatus Caldarchaeum subterraneum]|uniref:DNA polymerase n=1 Tax=Caldiarchaeum subterraneum TaxID=311458 RepID=E6N8N9_CALS0|nr:DNA polymerase I [Candidatus Caldarchaeum subterraneum]BAJ51363.1 DNA polymerase I [Candidatus Caldarchaeum subterraneum]